MGDIEKRFRADARCKVVSAGSPNGYKADLPNLIGDHRLPKVAVIGHSFAGIPIIDLIANHRDLIDYAGFIDPVSDEMLVSSYAMPTDRPKFYWCQRSKFGFETKLDITDAGEPEIVQGSHNELPHTAEAIDRIFNDVMGLP